MDVSSSPALPVGPSDDDRPVLRVRSLPDLLALVPVALGFEPHESLVVVAVAGPRTGFHVRVDLPTRRHDDEAAALADQVTAAALTQECARVAVVAFSTVSSARGRRRVDDLLRTVAGRLGDHGVDVLDVLRTDGGRYWSLRCTDTGCCPPEGTPYDPASCELRAEATLAGIVVAPDREALATRLRAVGGEARQAMHAATRAAEQEVVAALGLRGRRALARPPARALRAGAELGAARVDGLLDRGLDHAAAARAPAGGDAMSDADAAALSVWCSMTCFRDLAWCRMTRDNAWAHLAVWSAVARRVVPPYEPAVLSLAGFAAWLSGDGASAWCAVERAEAAAPHYSMAALLRETLTRCLPPDVWRPPPREVVLPLPANE